MRVTLKRLFKVIFLMNKIFIKQIVFIILLIYTWLRRTSLIVPHNSGIIKEMTCLVILKSNERDW